MAASISNGMVQNSVCRQFVFEPNFLKLSFVFSEKNSSSELLLFLSSSLARSSFTWSSPKGAPSPSQALSPSSFEIQKLSFSCVSSPRLSLCFFVSQKLSFSLYSLYFSFGMSSPLSVFEATPSSLFIFIFQLNFFL